jgi:hypothetical protein
MRNEFYGDRRDLWKWTTALRESSPDKIIVHVAMLDSSPRRPREKPEGVDEAVWRFFAEEWIHLDAESSRCSRIVGLDDDIRLISAPFDNRHRGKYFEDVAAFLALRQGNERYAVLLDPDTGITGLKPSRKHLCLNDIAKVWGAMRAGDVLLIYQHNAHVDKQRWIAEKKQILAKATGFQDTSQIMAFPHSDVCYFVLGR